MKTIIQFSALLVLLLAGCAKKRSTDRLMDTDGNRYDKSILLSTDQWAFKTTVVDTSLDGSLVMIGAASPLRIGHFRFTRDQLQFIGNVSHQSTNKAGRMADLINAWDITHSDYRLAESDGKVTNVEEENTDISWDERSHFKIDWKSAAINEFKFNPACVEGPIKSVVEDTKEVTPGHFSFEVEHTYEITNLNCLGYQDMSRRMNLENQTSSFRLRYSFAPLSQLADGNYKAIRYESDEDPLRKKYGFFETTVDRYDEASGFFQKDVMINRWHAEADTDGAPRVQKIYLARDFPDEYKWIYQDPRIGVAAVTNRVFEEHNIPLRFEFVEDDSVRFGDVRYSFIRWINDPVANAPFGYGPSDTHPLTGQILRSDSVIWTSVLPIFLQRIREIDQNEEDRRAGRSSLFQAMSQVLSETGILSTGDLSEFTETAAALNTRSQHLHDQPDEEADTIRSNRHQFTRMVSRRLFAHPGWAPSTYYRDTGPAFEQELDTSLSGSGMVARAFQSMVTAGAPGVEGNRTTFATMNHAVEGHQHDLHAHLHNPTNPVQGRLTMPEVVYPLEEVLGSLAPLLRQGATEKEIIDTTLYRVALHEFGHNINLRHNFFGSVDLENFPPAEPRLDRHGEPVLTPEGDQAMTRPVSSSVMDYIPIKDEFLSPYDWGPYDKAALVYAYTGGGIDLEKSGVIRLSNGELVVSPLQEERTFLYCSDQHAAWLNPFCNRHDTGTTPSEIMLSMIESYENAYETRNFRWGRAYWDTRSYGNWVHDTMAMPIKFIGMYQRPALWLAELDKSRPKGQWEIAERTIMDDLRRANALLAAFYQGVVQQLDTDKAFNDVIDPFTGNIQRIGITTDKLYAILALVGGMNFSIDTNYQTRRVSFLDLLPGSSIATGHPAGLAELLYEIIGNTAVVNPNLNVIGYESFGRALFVSNATDNYSTYDKNLIELMNIRCYSRKALHAAFGIDADQFYFFEPGYTLPADSPAPWQYGELVAARVDLDPHREVVFPGYAEYTVLDEPYFKSQGRQMLAIVRIDGNYYVAGSVSNRFAYNFMKDYAQTNSISQTEKAFILSSKRMHDQARGWHDRGCRTAEAGPAPVPPPFLPSEGDGSDDSAGDGSQQGGDDGAGADDGSQQGGDDGAGADDGSQQGGDDGAGADDGSQQGGDDGAGADDGSQESDAGGEDAGTGEDASGGTPPATQE